MPRTRGQAKAEEVEEVAESVVGVKRKTRPAPTKKAPVGKPVRSTRSRTVKETIPEVAKAPTKAQTSTRMAAAVLSKAEAKQTSKHQAIDEKIGAQPVPEKLKAVDQTLLQKVRRREVLEQLDKENFTNEKRLRRSLLIRLPPLVNHLRSYFR